MELSDEPGLSYYRRDQVCGPRGHPTRHRRQPGSVKLYCILLWNTIATSRRPLHDPCHRPSIVPSRLRRGPSSMRTRSPTRRKGPAQGGRLSRPRLFAEGLRPRSVRWVVVYYRFQQNARHQGPSAHASVGPDSTGRPPDSPAGGPWSGRGGEARLAWR